MPFPTPNGEQTFVDPNGDPYVGGTVYSYVPGTTTPSPTYTDQTLSVQNPNPVTLDAAGRSVMWTDMITRQVVYDMYNNLVWDQPTGIQIDLIPGNLQINGNLNVDGTSTFGGPATFNAELTAAGLTVTGDAQIDSTLTVNGATTLNSTLTVADLLTANNGLDVNNAQANFADGIVINGVVPGQPYDLILYNGDLYAGANADVVGNFTVNGQSTFVLYAGFNGGVDIAGLVPGEQYCLGVDGNAAIVSNLSVGGNLTVATSATIGTELVPTTDDTGDVGEFGQAWAQVTSYNYNTASDARLKRQVEALPIDPLEVISKVPVHQYRIGKSEDPKWGVMAQDMNKASGGVIGGNDNTIELTQMIAVMWAALQQIDKRLAALA